MTQNSTPARTRKPSPGRPFEKGVSGNPGGRHKGIVAVVKAKCGPNAEKLVELFWLYANGTDDQIKRKFGTKYGPRHEARIDALKELRNMGFGIPKQAIEVSGADDAPLTFTLKLADRSAD